MRFIEEFREPRVSCLQRRQPSAEPRAPPRSAFAKVAVSIGQVFRCALFQHGQQACGLISTGSSPLRPWVVTKSSCKSGSSALINVVRALLGMNPWRRESMAVVAPPDLSLRVRPPEGDEKTWERPGVFSCASMLKLSGTAIEMFLPGCAKSGSMVSVPCDQATPNMF